MRVAIIISRIDQLGPIILIQNLVNSLRSFTDLSLNVFYIDKDINDGIKMNVPVERLNRRNFCFADFDIIHTTGIRPDLFAFLHRKKIKYHISTIHNFVFEDLAFTYNKLISWFFGNIWLILLNRADKLVCVSAALKEYYAIWFKIEKLVVIYNGIGESDNSASPDKNTIKFIDSFHSKGLTVLGFAGILTRRKGVDQILRLLITEKDFAFVIIGDGKENTALMSEAKRLKVFDRCFFCGFKENAFSYFRYFDLFVMPSRSEGFGMALVEAIQQRVPVVCSNLKVFQELFNDSEVYYFKRDDQQSLTEAVKRAAFEKGTMKTDMAFERYQNNYTSKLMAESYYDLYCSVGAHN